MDLSLIKRDLKHVWHPCSYMHDFEKTPPLVVQRAEGSYIYTEQGPIIDGIASWWCKSLGHRHPAVIQAITKQLKKFEHVIGATTTYPEIVSLAEKLTTISGKQHVYFASDGSCAVEIALKLALQAMQIKGYPQRNQVLALSHGYHGETLATLSMSDLGLYKEPFQQLSLTCNFINNIPYVTNAMTTLWNNCEQEWAKIEIELNALKDNVAALIFEPIVQGAGGMRCYSPDFLYRLVNWARKHQIIVIADEIMTGLGRTGSWLAGEHAHISPDLICLSKGLTSGSLPLSCVLIDHKIYGLFSQDYGQGQAFLHSHTYSGNPLAVCAALATLQVMEDEGINQQAMALGACMQKHFNDVATQSGKLTNIRGIGGVIAGELPDYPGERIGFKVSQAALRRGALLRPLGNTLYWLPPLTIEHTTVEKLAEITFAAIEETYANL